MSPAPDALPDDLPADDLPARRATVVAVARDLIRLLAFAEHWDQAEWLARAVRVLDDPAASAEAVSAARVALHDGVLAPGGLADLPADAEPSDPTSLPAQLRDLAAQLYALTETP